MNFKDNFTYSRFQQYLDFLKASGTSQSTLDRKLSSLNSFQNFLVKKGYLTSTPKTDSNPILNLSSPPKNSNFSGKNFISRYLIFGTLIAIILGLGYGLYTQTILKAKSELAYSTASNPIRAGRILSFQGRLTDSVGNPITASTNVIFKFYNTNIGGTELYSSSIGNSQVVVPDENGIFSVIIGKTHGTEIPSSVFSENAEVWLEITAGGETMNPRQQIATVAYALNSETLQGLQPSASGLKDTVLVIDGQGNLNLGETSPTIKSTSGTMAVEGQALLLKASDGSGGNITINPDGNGTIRFLTEGTSPSSGGFVDLSNANIAGGNLINSQINNDNRGYNFLSFQNYDVGTTSLLTRFSIDSYGNAYISKNLSLNNNLTVGGTFVSVGSTNLVTNLNANYLNGYSYNNLPYDNYRYWQLQTNGTGTTNINSQSLVNIISGTGISLSQNGSNITINSSGGIGTTYAATNGLNLNSGNFGLGGTLVQDTSINLNSHNLSLIGSGNFNLTGNKIDITANNGGDTVFATRISGDGFDRAIIDSWGNYLTLGGIFSNNFAAKDSTNNISFLLPNSGKNLNFRDSSNTNTLISFTGDGSIGIGTTSPTQKLDINGSINIGGSMAIGSSQLVTNLNSDLLDGQHSNYFVNIGQTASFIQSLTQGVGISINGTGIGRTIAVNFNSTNLKISSSQLNTIQDITTTSNPTFAKLGLGNTSSAYILNVIGNGYFSTALTIGTSLNVGTNLTVGGTFTGVGSTNLVTNLNANYLNGHTDSYFVNVGQTNVFIQSITSGTGISITGSGIGRTIAVNYGAGLSNSGSQLINSGIIDTTNTTLTKSGSLGSYTLGLNLANSNTWTAAQTFANITVGGTFVSVGSTNLVTNLNANYLSGYSYNNLPYESPLTFNNGLTRNSNTIGLGGTLIQNTSINTNHFTLNIGQGDTQALFITSEGNIGIGDTNPSVKLVVNGDATIGAISIFENYLVTSNNDLHLIGGGSQDTRNEIVLGNNYGGISINADISSAQNIVLDTRSNGGYILLNNANVGLGTTSPTKKLDIVGDINLTGTIFANGSTGSGGQVLASNGSGSLQWISAGGVGTTYTAGVGLTLSDTNVFSLNLGSTNTWLAPQTFANITVGGTFVSVGSTNLVTNLNANYLSGYSYNNLPYESPLTFNNGLTRNSNTIGLGGTLIQNTNLTIGNTSVFFINTTTGNIGFGTTSPTSKLDINATGQELFLVRDDSNWKFRVDQWGNTITYGNLYATNGIHSDASNANLSLTADGTGSIVLNTDNNSNLNVGPGQLFVNGNIGNVGIGTTNPSQKLDVAGNINLNTNGTNFLFSTYHGANSDGQNIYIGGGGQSSLGASGQTWLGSNNIGIGLSALNSNTTGFQNAAFGNYALNHNTTGSNNSAIGVNALLFNNGDNNSALGIAAGTLTHTGTYLNQNSSNSLYLGASTVALADADTNEIVIGNNAIGNGSNSVVLGNDSIVNTILKGNVGLGTTNPSQKLDINGSINIGGSMTIGSTQLVTNLNADLLDGHHGTDYLMNLTAGIGITITGTNSTRSIAFDPTQITNTTFGNGSTFTWTFNTGNTNPTINFNNNGYIGIGTSSAPRTALEVNGTVAAQKFVDLTSYDQFFMDLANSDYNSSSLALDRRGSIKWNSTYNSGWKTIDNGAASKIENEQNGLLLATSIGATTAGSSITDWNQNIFLSNNGNVGIGTTNPNSKLEISGSTSTISNTSGDINIDSASGLISFSSDSITNFLQALAGSGSASLPSYSFSSDPVTGIFSNGVGKISIGTSGVARLTVDASGNVGIGTTNPTAKLEIANSTSTITNTSGDITISAASGTISLSSNLLTNYLRSTAGSGSVSAPTYSFSSDTDTGMYAGGANILNLATGGNDHLTIDASGNIGIGTTSPAYKLDINGALNVNGIATIYNSTYSSHNIELGAGETGDRFAYFDFHGDDTNTDYSLRIIRNNTGANASSTIINKGTGSIYVQANTAGVYLAASATAWSANSDIRLKNITSGFTNAIGSLMQLNPVHFTWKNDPNNTSNVGLIAQDVQKVLPEAISVNNDGYLGVRYTDLIPLLTAAFQELNTKVDDLFISSNGQVAVNFNISNEVLSSLGYSGTKDEIENATYSLTDSTGKLITSVGQFAQVTAAKITTGLLSAKNIIAENLSAKRITSETVLTGNLSATTVESDSVNISNTLTAKNIGASTATFSTVYASQIINPEGNISDVFAAKINSLRQELSNMIASSSATATPSAIATIATTWDTSIATDSANLNLDNLALSDTLTVGAMLTVNGQSMLNSANISNILTIGQIAIQDNILETTADNLYFQPSGNGTIHFLNDRLVLASDGSVTINGNVKINGSLVASLLQADTIETKNLTAEKINIATSSAEPIIAADASSSATATTSATLASNATVGTVTLAAGQTEITIQNTNLTSFSMIYLTPNGSTQNQVPYLKNKSGDTFTIAIDSPLSQNVDINWWLIN